MTTTQIAIIIVTFNSGKYIETCISSVIKALSTKNINRIIVVDNQSLDDTVKKVNSFISSFPNIELIKNNKNLGFAKAINIGLRRASGSNYFLLLNPDTVSTKSSVKNLLECAGKNHAGIVGGSTFNKNGTENGSYFRFPNIMVGIYDFTNIRKLDRSDKWHKYFYYLDYDSNKSQSFPVDVVTGGYMLISSEALKKTGYFDEVFFMYLEDVDYCLRARKTGIKIFHCNDSKIIHFSGRSSTNKDRIRHSSWILSRKKYYIKHFNFLENLIIQPIFLLDDLIILTNKYLKR